MKAERAGQVPYSRWKAMADYSLARLERLPVSVCTLGLLYCKNSGVVGQRGDVLNMVDLALLPITPIMGNGRAPLQPLEVDDAAARIAFLALTEPTARPVQATSAARRKIGLGGETSEVPGRFPGADAAARRRSRVVREEVRAEARLGAPQDRPRAPVHVARVRRRGPRDDDPA